MPIFAGKMAFFLFRDEFFEKMIKTCSKIDVFVLTKTRKMSIIQMQEIACFKNRACRSAFLNWRIDRMCLPSGVPKLTD